MTDLSPSSFPYSIPRVIIGYRVIGVSSFFFFVHFVPWGEVGTLGPILIVCTHRPLVRGK